MNEVFLSIYFNHTNDPRRIPKYEFIWWHCGSWYIAYRMPSHSICLSKKKQFLIYDHMRFLQSFCEWVELISFTCLFVCLSYPFVHSSILIFIVIQSASLAELTKFEEKKEEENMFRSPMNTQLNSTTHSIDMSFKQRRMPFRNSFSLPLLYLYHVHLG